MDRLRQRIEDLMVAMTFAEAAETGEFDLPEQFACKKPASDQQIVKAPRPRDGA